MGLIGRCHHQVTVVTCEKLISLGDWLVPGLWPVQPELGKILTLAVLTPCQSEHPGPAAAHRAEPPTAGEDAAARMPPLAGTLRMHCLCQHWNQDFTVLLEQLVTVVEERLVDSQVSHCQDLERGREQHALEERHLILLKKLLKDQEEQCAMVHQVVEATEEDHHVLNTMLSLAVTFMPPGIQLLALL
ncbi:hypothetical protein Y1Q_0018900 [Alligator mississippiensis]|uniref:Uncharacterized protein n=1 Tax=Alligator mississippiensis TaxID=8496 RepID=A0A151M338_ALLMI|nr:hypothetical protein Y1Q_0018900 [Alligator mississippiensis]